MENAESIKQIVREKYGSIAKSSGSCCDTSCCGGPGTSFVGEGYADQAGYMADADLGLGCGLPTDGAGIKLGETVLDLGSGAGNDVFVARALVGPAGRVIGVDMTAAMIEKARANNRKLAYDNVEFRLGEIEHLPVERDTVDTVISNCVLNLVPDKPRAFSEIHRVLKPGGRISISDIVLTAPLPENLRTAAELYVGCVAGAMPKGDYLALLGETGFRNIRVVKEKEIALPGESGEFGETLAILSITVQAEKTA